MSITSIQNINVLGANSHSIKFEGKTRLNSMTMPSSTLKSDSFVNSKGETKKAPVTDVINGTLAKYAPDVFMNKYLNRKVIEKALQKNPKIAEILNKNGIEAKIYMENIQGSSKKHFKTTYEAAKKLNAEISENEFIMLLEASLLHDIGKAFIPSEILNKPAKLSEEERKIVNLHAELGAEVLKTTDLDKKVIEAVKLHHREYACPMKQNNPVAQILSVADVYSALKEERPYKPQMSEEKVRKIMTADEKLNPHFAGKMVRNTTVPIFA